MRFFYYIFFVAVLFVTGCNKKTKQPSEETSREPELPAPNTELKCQDLPPAPVPFGWQDSLPEGDKRINAFLFDPVDPDKIIFVVNGDVFGFNKLYFYNIPSKQTKLIGVLGNYLPQINQNGWITYSDVDNNVFLIKNGNDNPITLVNDKRSHNPHWDYTGNNIYYYTEPYLNVDAQLLRIDANGVLNGGFMTDLPHFTTFKKTNRLLILETKNNICTIRLKDLTSSAGDQVLLTGPVYSKPGQINFDNITLDNTDENFFWSNSNGMFKCNIASLKIDTLFKNCQNFIYNNPIISFKENELTYSQEVITPLNSLILYHQFRAMEMNILTKELREIKIFP